VLQSNLAEYRGWQIFMQIKQRIFKCFALQICRLFFTAFWNFWRITRLSTTNHHWVINAQTGQFFDPPCTLAICANILDCLQCECPTISDTAEIKTKISQLCKIPKFFETQNCVSSIFSFWLQFLRVTAVCKFANTRQESVNCFV